MGLDLGRAFGEQTVREKILLEKVERKSTLKLIHHLINFLPYALLFDSF